MIEHSGADILAAYLIANGVVSNPTAGRAWPIFINTLPENPDEVVNANDTTGTMDGRSMRTGKTVEHPGIQVVVRGRTYRAAVKLGHQILSIIDQINNAIVTVQGKTYKVYSLRRMTSLIGVGKEEGGSRELVSANFTITYGENL